MNHLVRFENLDWISPDLGIRYKAYVHSNQRVRLAEFSEGFIESDWCHNGHFCHVLKGCFSIDYDGRVENYKKGDVVFIPRGEGHKHKVIMGVGGFVQLLLFENME